jgi:septal ring factor EnvC (AmiA/AmiB activator)
LASYFIVAMAKHLVLTVHSYLPTKRYKNIKKELESFNRYFLTKTNVANYLNSQINFLAEKLHQSTHSLKLTQRKDVPSKAHMYFDTLFSENSVFL